MLLCFTAFGSWNVKTTTRLVSLSIFLETTDGVKPHSLMIQSLTHLLRTKTLLDDVIGKKKCQ